MYKRSWVAGFAATAIGLTCVVGFVGCDGTGGDGEEQDGVQDFTPSGVTFGVDRPDPAVVEARPQAINPYAANASAQLPTSADLTAVMPPIGNQGALGSCTAWAAGYAAASYTANRQFEWGADSPSHQASPGYLYEMLLEEDNLNCGSGTSIATSMDLLVQSGCSSLATVPYTDVTCIENPSGADATNFKIGSFNRVVETDRHAIRGELSAGRPVVFGAYIYDDFSYFYGDDVYYGSGTLMDSGAQHAAHAMTLVGYDDGLGAYRVMNSWSDQWGDEGFMWMAFDTFEDTTFEAYSIEPSGEREPPDDDDGVSSETPNGYLDEAYQFADADPQTRETVVYLVFYYHFDDAVLIHTVIVTDPDGNQAEQSYETWYADGYIYFVQDVAFQWQPGTYHLMFRATTQAGYQVTYEVDADIEALEGGGGQSGGVGVCNDLCIFAFDGECDDGGPGSNYAVCDYGSDCGDCGPREAGGAGAAGESGENLVCTDTCQFAGDGECDDGGPGADYAVCDYGTDCTDCGARDARTAPVGGELCLNSCRFAFDGECDDGGPGSQYSECGIGTDCADCGPRPREDFGALEGPPKRLIGANPFGPDDPKVTTRTFRGMPVVAPPGAERLPCAGVREGVLGANRKPATIIPAGKE